MSKDKKDPKDEEDDDDEDDDDDDEDDGDKKKASGLGARFKKATAQKVMTSSLGKKIIPQEARLLLRSLRHIVTRVENAKKAKEIEKSIIKLIVKAKCCIDEKKVAEEEFLKADVPLRKAFNIIVDLYDFFGEKLDERTKAKFIMATECMMEVSGILQTVFKPHVQPKTLLRIKSVFDVIASKTFLLSVWEHPDINKDLEELVDAMNKYTQFNF